ITGVSFCLLLGAARRMRRAPPDCHYNASAVARIDVDWLAMQLPPLPLTTAVFAPATWRSPHSPRNCRTASMVANAPYMFGCTQDNPPPLVLTGNLPPGAIAPFSTNAPPSPFLQKPRSSSAMRVLIEKAS